MTKRSKCNQFDQYFEDLANTQATPGREAGKLTADLHFSSVPPTLIPQSHIEFCNRIPIEISPSLVEHPVFFLLMKSLNCHFPIIISKSQITIPRNMFCQDPPISTPFRLSGDFSIGNTQPPHYPKKQKLRLKKKQKIPSKQTQNQISARRTAIFPTPNI